MLRFMARRLLRTVPPYFVALALAYLAVVDTWTSVRRRLPCFSPELPDPMPFFLVSWSLCIEEHFYLVFPAVGALFLRIGRVGILLSLFLLCVPVVLRAVANPSGALDFGYYVTATHLRFDGLLLGVVAAWFRSRIEPQSLSSAFPVVPSFIVAAASLFFSRTRLRVRATQLASLFSHSQSRLQF